MNAIDTGAGQIQGAKQLLLTIGSEEGARCLGVISLCVPAGFGADPLRELCVYVSHGGCRLSDDQQVLRGLPRRSVLRWQRVHRPGRDTVPGVLLKSVTLLENSIRQGPQGLQGQGIGMGLLK